MLDMDNNMSLIQRKQLIQALELRISSYEREKVIWAYQSIQKPLMKSFYVNELETDVLVPVQCSVCWHIGFSITLFIPYVIS